MKNYTQKSKKQIQESYSETPYERRERRKKILKNVLMVATIILDVASVAMAIKGVGFSKVGRLVGLAGRTTGRSRFLF